MISTTQQKTDNQTTTTAIHTQIAQLIARENHHQPKPFDVLTLKVRDVFPRDQFEDMVKELTLSETSRYSGPKGAWKDRKALSPEDERTLKDMLQNHYDCRFDFDDALVVDVLRFHREAIWRAHAITKKLSLCSLKNFPGIKKEVLVEGHFCRPTVYSREQKRTESLEQFIDVWLRHFFGHTDAFKHHREEDLEEKLQLWDFYVLAIHDFTHYMLHKQRQGGMNRKEAALYGRLNFEMYTSDERDRKTPHTFGTESEAVASLEDVEKAEVAFFCGALCFIWVDKNGDVETDIPTFRNKIRDKIIKDMQKIASIENKADATPKEKKSVTVAYTGLRTAKALYELLERLQKDCTIIIGTRAAHKVSVENYPKNRNDIGSGVAQLALEGDIKTLEKIRDTANKMYEEVLSGKVSEFHVGAQGVTGGDYENRLRTSDAIKEKVLSTFTDMTATEKRAVLTYVQPISPEAEKNSLFPQRPLFMSDRPHILMQCGNRDALIAQNGELKCGVSVKLTEELKGELVAWASKYTQEPSH